MRTWDRYILRRFGQMLLFVAPGLGGIYLVALLFQRIDDLIRSHVSAAVAARYLALLLPSILYQLSPLILLLAGLLTLMLAVKAREMMAVRSLGMSPVRAAAPVVAGVASVSLLFFVADLFLIPKATKGAREIWRVQVDKKPLKGLSSTEGFFYHGNNRIWRALAVSSDGRRMRGVTILSFGEDFSPRESIHAEEARFQGEWIFLNGLLKSYGGGTPKVSRFARLARRFEERPEDFVAVETPAEESNILLLMGSIQRMKEYGLDTSPLEARVWSHILYPFLGISLMVAVLPVVTVITRGGMALSIGLSLGLGLACWFVWGFLVTLGKTGAIHPALAPVSLHLLLLGSSIASAFKRKLT